MFRGIEHQEPADVPRDEGVRQAPPAVAAHGGEVGEREPRRLPFAEGELRRADLHTVVVVRRAVAEGRAFRGVDLAAVAIGLVHGLGSLSPEDRGDAARGSAESEAGMSLSALHR
jgi:hypothetical protein